MIDLSEIVALAETFMLELPSVPEAHTMPVGGAIAGWIDHTLLKPEATTNQIEKLCMEAVEYRFASVCVNPVFVPLVTQRLTGTPVKVCTVVGFPLGATMAVIKSSEAAKCLQAGASELDMVLHVGSLKGENYEHVFEDILGVVEVAQQEAAIVKVILETSALTKKEKIIACLISKAAGADYVKTSTGFGSGGATAEDIELMYRVSSPEVSVKASGGIRSLSDAQQMIAAGASRLGTSSGVTILREALERDKTT